LEPGGEKREKIRILRLQDKRYGRVWEKNGLENPIKLNI